MAQRGTRMNIFQDNEELIKKNDFFLDAFHSTRSDGFIPLVSFESDDCLWNYN